MRRRLAWTAILGLASACGTTAQEYVDLPVSGAGAAETTGTVGDWTITLDTARVGFGPAYFCATKLSDVGLCPVAIVEFAGVAELDALDPEPQELGHLDGTTGDVHSALFNLGIVWLLPAQRPQALDGAPEGHSAILEGVATSGSDQFRFSAEVDLTPLLQGGLAYVGQRTDVTIDDSGEQSLIVHVDPMPWLERVDFDALFALGADPVAIEPGTTEYDAIVISMSSRHPPELEWLP